MKRASAPLRWTQLLACAYALVLAFLCHARWMPGGFLAVMLGTVALRVGLRKISPRRVHLLLKLLLMLAFGALVIRSFHNLFGREAGSGLLAAMLALKLVESETRRDGLLLLAVSCFLAMCGFLFDQGVLQAVLAAVTLAFLMAGLNVLQPLPDDAPAEARRDVWWPYADLGLASLGRLMLMALPFAIGCFLFFPRLDRPLWGAPEDAFKGRTGISERMAPGSLAGIALDDRVAFQVRYEGTAPAPRDRYYRALTLVHFDGSVWTPGDPRPDAALRDAKALGPLFQYEILLQPTDQRWLPFLDLEFDSDADAHFDATRQATARDPVVSARLYHGTSASRYQLRSLPPSAASGSRRLPGRGNPQSRALAQRWRAEHGDDDHAIVEAALAMFHAGFAYSLEPPLVGANGVDDFLFQFQSGYCEHYAGAFAFLMRAAGIPARVVIGFQGGYFNATGGFFNVRLSDAHAWDEVWFPDQGWVRVDPTAAVSPERIERGSLAERAAEQAWFAQGGVWTSLRDRLELVGYWWNQGVIQFSALRQRNLMEALKLGEDSGLLMVVAMVVSGLLGLALAAWIGSRAFRDAAPDPLLAAYRRYCARIAAAGVARAPSEGPERYAERAAGLLPEAAVEIRSLSDSFIRLRYSGRGSPEQAREWMRRARGFRVARRATRKRAGSS